MGTGRLYAHSPLGSKPLTGTVVSVLSPKVVCRRVPLSSPDASAPLRRPGEGFRFLP
jgi:methyl coenzyme M reductase subunit C-like uncharacterized protein (methanogenesis marker protein 7)